MSEAPKWSDLFGIDPNYTDDSVYATADQRLPPVAAIQAGAAALDAAECTCRTGRNQYGSWYQVSPYCPRCGDSTAKAAVVLAAALPHLGEHSSNPREDG